MTTNTITALYGSNNTPCEVFVYELNNGLKWYCIEDSKNVNATYEDLYDGIDTDTIEDVDTASSNDPINSEDELKIFIDDGDEEKVQTFTLIIDEFNHQAMTDNPGEEVIRILKGIISNIENNGLRNCDGLYLKDFNGNNVGSIELEVY